MPVKSMKITASSSKKSSKSASADKKTKPKAKPKPNLSATKKQADKKGKSKTFSTSKAKTSKEIKSKGVSSSKAVPTAKNKTVSEKAVQRPKPESKQVRVSIKDEADRKERLRKLLVQKREDILREAKTEIKKFQSGEKRQLVETVLDDGDLSVMDIAEDISLQQLNTHRQVLIKIDEAIRKLAEGTYAVCDDCGDEISEERLKVMPFAVLCRDCQEKKEVLEKIEKRELGD
ncbi:MAG: TraR/DksA family transcriptional regulator [Nitrospirae bacterium]|nr:TraR/DksA family transcriptional regulator [Nitrospirota bacterium]